MLQDKIVRAQKLLQEENLDGWLIYDFQKRNPLAMEFLEIPSSLFLTRRLFYWIPKKGTPVKIVHATDGQGLENLPGKAVTYFKWQTLEEELGKVLSGVSSVAMEYSPRSSIPAVSFVDGGILDLVREKGATVISSARLIQEFVCLLTEEQRKSHLEAALVLEETVNVAWDFLSQSLRKGTLVTEYDVHKKMADTMLQKGCVFEGGPICAVNAHICDPHYVPKRESSSEIRKGDFVLIDLWCKKNGPKDIYADISRVAVADKMPTEEQKQVFFLVRNAQKKATELVKERFLQKKPLKGWEVDQAARQVIEDAGYGAYFVHRTGHNIYIQDHGPGTHMDSIETWDDRPVLAETCFSIEPGIYLPEKFGVRLEYDVFITKDGVLEITGGEQNEITNLLA